MNDSSVDKAVRRVVGLAALRRLRGLVDADAAQQQADARWAVRLSWAFAVAAVLAVGWLSFR